jgi:anti-anti-sigma factor
VKIFLRFKLEDFGKIVIKDIVVEIVNLSRATYKEAAEFKRILNDDYEMRFKKLIVDIRQCEFIDSTFLGVLVVALKNMAKIGGEIRLVKPSSVVQTLMEKVGTLTIFNTYDTLEEAVESFNFHETIIHR